ncbi:MarR family transcriptional regulator [Alcanivorax hongdengensis A-11-3]|uniref:MarR family transcriptional regulator n=1 Tax=Alcanivorax hongdengensis A-11-3 TaxID=1177179 RepID=L0WBI3_9GAMM|nr:MarR family transcriptional regulator [Alcanivorax hongdengensis]EKF73432.1 MarR family transcriptional regulator [Alcanivorax hongdengensis A-11-3]
MDRFSATEKRINRTCQRHPAFPRESAKLVRLIKALGAGVHGAANAALREYGLNHTDYNVLMMLYGSDDGVITPTELRDAAAEKSANVTRVCNALCERGWIQRVPDGQDRRKVMLSLTAEGEALIERFLPSMAGLLDFYAGIYNDEEMATLERLLKRLLARVETLEQAP